MSTSPRDAYQLEGNSAVAACLRNLDVIAEAPRLAESEYVNLALAFASLRLPMDAGLAHGVYTQLMTGLQVPDLLPDPLVSDDAIAGLHEAQERFVRWLESIRNAEPRAILKVASALSENGNRLLMRPAFVAGMDTVEVSYRYYPADFEAALGFVLMLLVDKHRPYIGNVCRCKYADCQRFFLAIKSTTGRPRRDYCSASHFALARTASGAARIRAYRQKVSEQRKRSTRRKAK